MAEPSDGLDALVAECLERIERDGPGAIDAMCREHPDRAEQIRARVERLVEFGLIERPVPRRVGTYELLRSIGTGGMGEVYLARQDEPVVRLVALKLIKPGGESRRASARFEFERQALAMLNHDGIAKIYDAGSTDDGRMFFAMELVDGDPITTWCERERPSIDERLRLAVAVCRAVQHAHQAGIIHRDLKPSNILVSGPANAPVVKVIDFGLAKATDAGVVDATLTLPGHVVGTLAYLSPEQTSALEARVDTRSDVYAIGTLLYLLLTGEHPLPELQAPDLSLPDAFVAIRERIPLRPSARVAPGQSSAEIVRRLRGDLDWIVGRALEKEPERRYASVGALADDIERHLRHLPVEARPPSAGYVLGRFVRRHRRSVTAAVLVATIAVISFFAILALLFENKRLAKDNEVSAKENERSKVDFSVLERAQELAALLTAEDEHAWPATPAGIAPLKGWLDRVGQARQELVGYRKALLPPVSSRDRVLHGNLDRSIGLLVSGDGDNRFEHARHRLKWARQVFGLTVEAHAERWAEARRAIREHAAYRGLDLPPQVGLVPLGPDPDSMLWEFAARLPGTELPKRDADGRLQLAPLSAPILVLIPATDGVWLGAQKESRDKPNYDAATRLEDHPSFNVALAAYFFGKHEVSKAQWHAMTQIKPGFSERAMMLPMHSVTWYEADRSCRGWGFTLPTEAQWERAVRGGTSTSWFTGQSPETQEGYVNLADEANRLSEGLDEGSVSWNDGHARYCLIDGRCAERDDERWAIQPNPFGLLCMTGNVAELCLDPYEQSATELVENRLDGLRRLSAASPRDLRARRGGAFLSDARRARSAYRIGFPPGAVNDTTGFRIARMLDTEQEVSGQ